MNRIPGKLLVIAAYKNNFSDNHEHLGEVIHKVDGMLFGLF